MGASTSRNTKVAGGAVGIISGITIIAGTVLFVVFPPAGMAVWAVNLVVGGCCVTGTGALAIGASMVRDANSSDAQHAAAVQQRQARAVQLRSEIRQLTDEKQQREMELQRNQKEENDRLTLYREEQCDNQKANAKITELETRLDYGKKIAFDSLHELESELIDSGASEEVIKAVSSTTVSMLEAFNDPPDASDREISQIMPIGQQRSNTPTTGSSFEDFEDSDDFEVSDGLYFSTGEDFEGCTISEDDPYSSADSVCQFL